MEFGFSHEILQITDDIGTIGGIVWPLLICDAIVWIVIYFCIMKGAKSVIMIIFYFFKYFSFHFCF